MLTSGSIARRDRIAAARGPFVGLKNFGIPGSRGRLKRHVACAAGAQKRRCPNLGRPTVAKLQHYVPQSYLRSFASEGGKTPRIWCYDKTRQRAFKTNVRNVAAERTFYERSDSDQPLEDRLGRVESAFGSARPHVISMTDPAELSSANAAAVALFIAAQLVRTREHRQSIEDLMSQMGEWLRAEAAPELQASMGPCDAEQAREQQIASLNGDLVPSLAEVILKMKWVVLTNETNRPLWSSDHPVTLFNPVDAGPRGNLGLTCAGIQLYLPLSPSATLAACDPVMYAEMPSRGQQNDENVTFQNSLQVQASTRYLFASSSDFTLADRILVDHPDLADPARRRLRVE